MPVLKIDNIIADRASFRLGPITLELNPGINSIIGPNGSGKTTLISTLVGDVKPTSGEVEWDGAPLSRHEFGALEGVSYVPDATHEVFFEMTAIQLWAMHARIQEANSGAGGTTLIEHAFDLAEALNFSQFDKKLKLLSLGNKKKVHLISGLMNQPRLLIIDEPQNGLDFLASTAVQHEFKRLASDGSTILMSNHDIDSVARISERTMLLQDGQVVQSFDMSNMSADDIVSQISGVFGEQLGA